MQTFLIFCKHLILSALPLYGQEVWIDGVQDFYSLTDEIELLCNSGTSSPKAVLSWSINDRPMTGQDDCSDRLVKNRLINGQMDNDNLHRKQLPTPMLIDATDDQSDFQSLSEDNSEQPIAKALNGLEGRWTETSSAVEPQSSFLPLRLCANEQLWTKQHLMAKCEAIVQLNFSRNSDLVFIEKRNNLSFTAGKHRIFSKLNQRRRAKQKN